MLIIDGTTDGISTLEILAFVLRFQNWRLKFRRRPKILSSVINLQLRRVL